MRDRSRRVYRREEDGFHVIHDIEHEGGIYWISDGKRHDDETQQAWVNSGRTRLSPTKMATTAEERYELITRGIQETLGKDIIKKILVEGNTPKCYWGQSFDQ